MTDDLMWLIDGDTPSKYKKETTFLSVLGRSYDEDLISRVLVYIMDHDHAFVRELLRMYAGDTDLPNLDQAEFFVYPEKSMGKGRADIFAVVKKHARTIATITIENKIRTEEHDDQTQTYYDWVYRQQEYQNADVNAFFYLRPSFNLSTAVCDQYQNITYTQIAASITQSDHIIDDFKKHIALYLGDSDMELNAKQIDIINHYDAIQQSIGEATAMYAAHKAALLKKIENAVKQRFPDIVLDINEKTNPLGPVSVRFYKDKWYKASEYYFYAELYFEKARLHNAKYQKVIKEYPRKSTEKSIHEFLQSDKIRIDSIIGQWYIWGDVSNFDCKADWTSKEWGEAFVSTSVKKLAEFIEETDKMVDTYFDFMQNGMK